MASIRGTQSTYSPPRPSTSFFYSIMQVNLCNSNLDSAIIRRSVNSVDLFFRDFARRYWNEMSGSKICGCCCKSKKNSCRSCNCLIHLTMIQASSKVINGHESWVYDSMKQKPSLPNVEENYENDVFTQQSFTSNWLVQYINQGWCVHQKDLPYWLPSCSAVGTISFHNI